MPQRGRDTRTTEESVEKDRLSISKRVLKFSQSFAGKPLINVLKRSFCARVCVCIHSSAITVEGFSAGVTGGSSVRWSSYQESKERQESIDSTDRAFKCLHF